jgi:hypothetical protein
MNHSATIYQRIIAPMLPLLQKEVDRLENDTYSNTFANMKI